MAAKEKMPGCTSCAQVKNKMPLEYRYVNRLIKLKSSTMNKKLVALACPVCDRPMIENAKKRAGMGIDD